MVYSLCVLDGLAASDAEDVSQEVMVSALRGLRGYKDCRLSTWLYRLTRRRLADHFRSPQRRHIPAGLPDAPPLSTALPCPHPNPEQEAIQARENERTREALNALAEPVRSIMLAYYLGEVPVRDIAREMSMAENTVKSHLRRGRLSLRQRLGEEP